MPREPRRNRLLRTPRRGQAPAQGWRRLERLQASRHPYLVAESEGAVLGFAYAGPYRLRPAYRYTVEDSIYVAPDAMRAGITMR